MQDLRSENGFMDWCGVSIQNYPVLPGECDDTQRLFRAVESNPGGVVVFPKGVYRLSRSLHIRNHCSLHLAKDATFLAVEPMDYIVEWNGGMENLFHDYGMFISGGVFDGGGISGGIRLRNIHHFTMNNTWLKDCKVGLCVGNKEDYKNYELYASNVYMRNGIGIPDSVGLWIPSHADHYFDGIVIVDYQTGFRLDCGSTYMSKCHSWVTNVIPDMTKTIAYDLGGSCNTLSDCYTDTAQIGLRIRGSNYRLSHVFGYHNGTWYGGKNHVFVSYETTEPFFLDGGTFVGSAGCGDIFFRGAYSPKLHMRWVECKNLTGTEILEEIKKNEL